MEFWVTVGLSGLLALGTSAGISVWGVSRNIKHKAIIEERQKWRDSLRGLVPQLVSEPDLASREKIRDEIALRLNPYKGRRSLELIDQFVSNPSPRTRHQVIDHFQDMLKRDWERAKIEA